MSTTSSYGLRALSIDGELATRLRRGAMRGEVHSSFPHVVNLVAGHDSLISLCARLLDDAPWSIRVDVSVWPAGQWAPGVSVEVTNAGVMLGADRWCAVGFGGASRWHPSMGQLAADTASLVMRVASLAELMESHGVRGGAMPLPWPDEPFSRAVGTRVRDAVAAIHSGEVSGDRAATAQAIAGILGLGPGLTPTGDDVLTGIALVAAHHDTHIALFREALCGELDRRPDCTTLISRATLREAVIGRGRQSLMGLLDQLVAAGPACGSFDEGLRDSAQRVLDIGHTSGTDILYGIVAGLRLETELRGLR